MNRSLYHEHATIGKLIHLSMDFSTGHSGTFDVMEHDLHDLKIDIGRKSVWQRQ